MQVIMKAERLLLMTVVSLYLTSAILGQTETTLEAGTTLVSESTQEPETQYPQSTVESAEITTETVNDVTTETSVPSSCYTCIPGTAQSCLVTGELATGCLSGSVCYVSIKKIEGVNETFSMGCTLETEDCIYYYSNNRSIDDCPNNETCSFSFCCTGQFCNVDILTELLPATAGTPETPPAVDLATTPSPAESDTAEETSESLFSTQAPPAEEPETASTPVPVQETTALPDSGTTPVPAEPEITEAVPTTVEPSAIVPEETSSAITTPDSSSDVTCYGCTSGLRGDCLATRWPQDNACPIGSFCFVSIASNGESNETVSMGCTPDIGDCSFYERSSDEVVCSDNETDCLFCCNWQWCNEQIIVKLNPKPVASTTTTASVPPTATPEPPTDSSTTPETGTTELPTSSVSATPILDSPTTESPAKEDTSAPPETFTTPVPPASHSTPAVTDTDVPETTESPTATATEITAAPSAVIPEETTSSAVTTPDSSSDVTCYGCTSGLRGDCLATRWPQDNACPLGSFCFVSIASNGESNETVSMGCTPDIGDCSFYERPSDEVVCPDNETDCLFCCNWQWCNEQIIVKLNPKPTPVPPTATPEPQTEASTPPSETGATDIPSSSVSDTPIIPESPTIESPATEDTSAPPETLTTPIPSAAPSTPAVVDTGVPETTESPTAAIVDTTAPPETLTTLVPSASPSTPAVIETDVPETSDSTSPAEEISTATPPLPPSSTPASTAAATVAPSTVPPTPRDKPLTCHQCTGGEPSSKICNNTANIEHCAAIDDVCSWAVNYTDGVFKSFKGCVQRDECQALSATNNDSCSDFVTVKGECNWCCEDADFCNYDRGDYSVTPPPFVPTTPTPGSCDMSICLLQFQLLVAQASKEPDLFFNEFCRSVPLVFACLANTSESCGYCDGGQRDSFEMILANMTSQCPIACDADAGFNCTITFYYEIIEKLSHGGSCLEIYEIVYVSEKCRVRTVGSCDAGVRDNIDIAYTAIKTEVDGTCNATESTIPPFNGTDSEYCNVTNCLKCITDLGDIILLYFNKTGGDIFDVCGAIQIHYDCYWKYASQCSDGTRFYLEAAWQFTIGLISEQCANKICDTTKARTCIVDLMTLIETKKDIQGACRSIAGTIECVVQNTEGCALDEQESLNRTLQYTLDLIGDQCKDNVKLNINDTIEICEGGEPGQISFIFTSSPEAICGDAQNCKVFIDIEIETGNYPLCGNKKPIRQAVVVRSGWSETTDGLCSFEINDGNWDTEQNVSIAAKVDFKYDGIQRRQMIVWFRKTIDGATAERRSLANTTLVICDRDRQDSMCSSVNDPHIKTFDGWYFNNFLEGFFILYRHTVLPYEVQIATQRCNSQASCNCAVAVRCGDTVLYIDKCRKKSFVKKWCFGPDKYKCANVMKVHLYGHDLMTPGLRIFSKNNGKLYYVWFPHGQTVKITIDGDYLSIWITPSPYDIGSAEGLCGNYDGVSTNDLMYRNQSLYYGEGYNVFRGQPKGWCKDWQASLIENIYSGVAPNPYVPDLYCECEGVSKNSSVISTCNYNALVETCDMESGGVELGPPFEYSNSDVDNNPGRGNNGNHNGRNRRRRQAEDPLADNDMDTTFDPPNITNDQAAMDNATITCTNFFNSIAVAQACQDGGGVANFTTSIAGCVDDILATGTTDYMTAALEALKTQCTAELAQNPTLVDSPIATQIAKVSCLNQCTNSAQGTCVNGTCVCESGFSGEDCGFNEAAQPQYVEVYNSVCDVSKDDCSSAQVTGDGFIPNITSCQLQQVKVTENGVEAIGDDYEPSHLNFVSPNEVHCQLKGRTSAFVKVQNSGTASNSTLILVYDSTCYTCTQLPTVTCARVKNSCIIESTCYGPGQENADDKCKICRPENSDSEWTHNSDSESCSSTNIPLIVGLCVGLGGGLILLTIIIIIVVVYKVRCYESKKLMTPEEYETISRGSVHRSRDFSYDNLFQSSTDTDVAGSIRGGKFSYKDPPPDYDAKGTIDETFAM